MNRFRILLSSVILLCLFMPKVSMAQSEMSTADSVVYNTMIYSELYNDYKMRNSDINKEVIDAVAKVLLVDASDLNINTKLIEDLYLDSLGALDLLEQVKKELSFYEDNGDTIVPPLKIVGNIVDVVKPRSDSTMLIMAYYPWKAVFDTRSVNRVGLYNDGIGILKGLIEYTCDSIQREIYIDELMEVYDVWYELADTINANMNETFSKTMIKSDKVRDYIDMYPEEITEKNVYEPQFVRMYDYIMDALNEPENQEEVHYLSVDKLMRISIQRLKHNWKQYQEQYVADFETFDVRMQLLLEHVTHPGHVSNINILHEGHADNFDQISTNITASTGDCGAMEEAFAMQMFEKAMDEKFLNRVIRSMRGCPDSDVYVEALENYTYLFATVTTENVDDVLAKRRLLANVYLKRERYDEAIEQIKYMLSVEKDNVEKANLYYLWGNILERQGNNQTAAFRYKSAVGLNPNFGNAFYRLAIMYSKNKFTSDPLKDSYRYLLCIDKLERAKECIQQHAGSATMSKYNNASINDINGYIASFKSMCPLQTEAFMLGAEYSTPGRTFTFPGGVMKGEKTTIRFY